MPDTKVYEKFDLLCIYDGTATNGEKVGEFKTQKTHGGIPPLVTETVHMVYATTTVYFSEAKRWLIFDHGVYATDDGLYRLPKWHWYNDKDLVPNVYIIPNAHNSKAHDLCIAAEVAKWKVRVAGWLPADYPTPDDKPSEQVKTIFDAVRAEYVKQGARVDADGVIHVGGEDATAETEGDVEHDESHADETAAEMTPAAGD